MADDNKLDNPFLHHYRKACRLDEGQADYKVCEKLLQSMCQMHDCLAVMINDVARTMGTLVGKVQLDEHSRSQDIFIGKRETRLEESQSRVYNQMVVPSTARAFPKRSTGDQPVSAMSYRERQKRPGCSYIISKKEVTQEELEEPVDHAKLMEELDDIEDLEDLVANFSQKAAPHKKLKIDDCEGKPKLGLVAYKHASQAKESTTSNTEQSSESPKKPTKKPAGLQLPVSWSQKSSKCVY